MEGPFFYTVGYCLKIYVAEGYRRVEWVVVLN
jgi:hypothetical protein